MPYNTEWENKGIIWKFYDHVSAQEIEDANAEFYGDERSDRSKYQIIDALNVSSLEWNEIDIASAAAHDIGAERIIKNMKVAYVAKDEDIIAKLEKYIDISKRLNSSWKFKGFEDLLQAKKWVESSI